MAGVTESLQQLKDKLPEPLATYDFTLNIVISIVISALTVILISYYVWMRKLKEPVMRTIRPDPNKPRFRKRDKVMFYGRKMLRRVRSFAQKNITTSSSALRRKKSKLVLKLAKKLMHQFKRESQPQLKPREPPQSILEVDWPMELEHSEHRLPAEVMYMLRSVRVLGHFEKPIFLELCRFMESKFVPAGSFLFKIGDLDESIYVVQSGKVNVYVSEPDDEEISVKEVGKGDSIHSLLSILDVITGHPAPYKTVSAVAVEDSTVLRLPAKAFQIVLDRFPESMVRVVQIIMVRLQRVTFMALHNYLGLSNELINPANHSDKLCSVHSISISQKGSPIKIVPTTTSSEGETVTKVTNYDEDVSAAGSECGTRFVTDSQDLQKKAVLRRLSEPPAGSQSGARQHTGTGESKKEPSDFDVACARARVGGTGNMEDDPIVSGSPPVRQMSADYPSRSHRSHTETDTGWKSIDFTQSGEELMAGASRRSFKKAVLSDNVSYIPDAGVGAQPVSSANIKVLDDEEIMNLATEDIVQLFGLDDDTLLQGRCFLRYIKAGQTLVKQGDQDASLYFVVTGQLQVQQTVVGKDKEKCTLFVVRPGEVVGALAVLTGEPSFFTIKSATETRVVTISKQHFYAIMKAKPQIVLNVGHTVVRRMSKFVRQIDFALDWSQIEAGKALFRQGEQSDCVYIILNGRLRSVVTLASEKKELVGEYGRGELVGIVEVLTLTERATTLMAVRDTELAKIPSELLNMIKRKYPQIVTRLIHLLGQKILGSLQNRPNLTSALSEHPNVEPRPSVANLATVAILPVSEDSPLTNFTMELQHSLLAIGPTLRLTSNIIQHRLGISALDSVNEYRLSSWLGQQEDIHRMVLYQCDMKMTAWTQRCIRQADCILIVSKYTQEPKVGQIEKAMENLAVRAQKELILLYPEEGVRPKNTVEWLNLRDWCSSHHHIRCPKRVFSQRNLSKQNDLYRRLFEAKPDRMSDFSRLARFLTGTSIGLVLGGGGARGLSQVGLIRALHEAGIPIDIIGGTSIGSFMGALWAEERNITRFTQRAREWSIGMTSLLDKVLDITYPATAMFKGSAFNKAICNVFKDRQVEDLWIPYFAITTDITASKMRVHTSGSLWRYVRASMSLSGYLPPLCDPVDGHLLLDGGYVNNLPADVMKSLGAQTIFAVDVGSQDDTDLTAYGDELSGWWILWKKWNPWAKPVKVPNMAEIQTRLAYVSCVRQMEIVKNSDYCEYIRPPIDRYRTLQFGSFDEIHDVGYNHGKTLFGAWEKNNAISTLFHEKSSEKLKPVMQKHIVPAEANFTDLAELISRIDKPSTSAHFYISDEDMSDDDDRMSVTSEPTRRMSNLHMRKWGRPGSEGATPGSTPSDEDPLSLDDLEDEDEDGFDEDDEDLEDDLSHLQLLDDDDVHRAPGSPPRIIQRGGGTYSGY